MPILSKELNITEKTKYLDVLARLMDTIAPGSGKLFSDNFELVDYYMDLKTPIKSAKSSIEDEITDLFYEMDDREVACSLILGKLLKIAHESKAYLDAKDIGFVAGADNNYYIIFSWYTGKLITGGYTSLVFHLNMPYNGMEISKVDLHHYQVKVAIYSGKYSIGDRLQFEGRLNIPVEEVKHGKYAKMSYSSITPYTDSEYITEVFNKYVLS